MEDTADSAGDSAAELEGFSERFAGAMSAAVTALAVGAAGLLSQVPVLGELFGGLGAIVDALAFQMDQVLRPVLSPLTDGMFNLSSAIFEADGVAGDIIGTLTAFVSAALVVAGAVGTVAAQIWGWGTVFSTAGSLISSVVSGLGSFVTASGGFISGSLAAAAAIGALIGVLSVAALEVTGVLDIFRSFGQFVGNSLPKSVANGMLALIGAAIGPLAVIGAAIVGFVQGFLEGGLWD